ncbi:MAG TPA: type II toxin-antitoxin system VapC family toxin [Allosphingosinicella sp.]
MSDRKYLLDSNILIYLLEGTSPETRSHVEACATGELATSAVAYAEVMWKVPSDDPVKRAQVEQLFEHIEVLPFDALAGEAYKVLPFERHRFDHLIAAHALSRDLIMVTGNARHFRGVPSLRVEDWTSS